MKVRRYKQYEIAAKFSDSGEEMILASDLPALLREAFVEGAIWWKEKDSETIDDIVRMSRRRYPDKEATR